MRRSGGTLIVTADDFGLAEEVNEAIEQAHCAGVLTAASLMVSAPAAADAVARARRLSRLKVGLHVTLVDGAPTLPHAAIPDLVEDGRFRCDLARLGVEIAFRPSVRRQLRAEIAAQFAAFAATGLQLDHVDAHAHFHLHPMVAAEIIEIGRRYGLRALRVPREPRRVLARVEPGRSSRATPLDFVVARLAEKTRRASIFTSDAVFGWAWSGAFGKERLLGLLRETPDGVVEIYTHPATSDRFVGHAPVYLYRQELEALCAPEVKAVVESRNLRLGSYSDEASM